jgi:hypothetical protein
MMKRAFPGVLLAALMVLGLTGCKSECQGYCERYQVCIEDDIDLNQCTDRCQAASDQNDDHRSKVRECADCVESRTCAQSFDECVDDCIGVQGP